MQSKATVIVKNDPVMSFRERFPKTKQALPGFTDERSERQKALFRADEILAARGRNADNLKYWRDPVIWALTNPVDFGECK